MRGAAKIDGTQKCGITVPISLVDMSAGRAEMYQGGVPLNKITSAQAFQLVELA